MNPNLRKRHLVRTVVRTLAGCAVFLGWYVGCWLGYTWLAARGTINPAAFEPAGSVVFAPLNSYSMSRNPGADGLQQWRDSMYGAGKTRPKRVAVVKVRRAPDVDPIGTTP